MITFNARRFFPTTAALLLTCLNPTLTLAETSSSVVGILDANASHGSDFESWLSGGTGKLVYDANNDGLNIGTAAIGVTTDFNLTYALHLSFVANPAFDQSFRPTEFFFSYKPVPDSAFRQRFKAGLF